MRAEATMRNSAWGFFQQAVICILSLFLRRIMIDTIGVEGVGLNGLLANVVTVLSVADMGISSAIVFHMYKPLAYGENDTIVRLMNFYRTVYRYIALGIFLIGLVLMPFMKYIVHDVSYTDGYVRLIYFLFLLQTVVTYLFGYKRSLLSADQKQYIISIYDLVFKVGTVIGGIIVLKLTREIAYYLIFLIVAAVFNNILIALKVNKLYPHVKRSHLQLEKEHRKLIFKDVKNIFIGRISATITNSTDNILISALVGTVVTGLYSNYSIILNTVTAVMSQFSASMMGSVGNLIATETSERISDVLKKLIFIMFFMASFCSVCLVCLIDPFITLAFGKNLLLERYVVYICVAVFYCSTVKIPVWNMMQASGLFKQDKYISITGSTLNLIVSFILGKSIGVAGILLGTVCTYVVQYSLKMFLFHKRILHKSSMKLMLLTVFYFAVTAAECFFVSFVLSKLPAFNPYLRFLVCGICAAMLTLGINTVIFRRTSDFIYFKNITFSVIKKNLVKRGFIHGH